jgi:hypothetical protein
MPSQNRRPEFISLARVALFGKYNIKSLLDKSRDGSRKRAKARLEANSSRASKRSEFTL